MKKKYNSRFPVMRVKRIMQTDEDVGKVAMATPVVISKTLETFLEDVINKTAECARNTGSKRLSASHLKEVINSTPTFDFLTHLTENVTSLPPGQALNSTYNPRALNRTPSNGSVGDEAKHTSSNSNVEASESFSHTESAVVKEENNDLFPKLMAMSSPQRLQPLSVKEESAPTSGPKRRGRPPKVKSTIAPTDGSVIPSLSFNSAADTGKFKAMTESKNADSSTTGQLYAPGARARGSSTPTPTPTPTLTPSPKLSLKEHDVRINTDNGHFNHNEHKPAPDISNTNIPTSPSVGTGRIMAFSSSRNDNTNSPDLHPPSSVTQPDQDNTELMPSTVNDSGSAMRSGPPKRIVHQPWMTEVTDMGSTNNLRPTSRSPSAISTPTNRDRLQSPGIHAEHHGDVNDNVGQIGDKEYVNGMQGDERIMGGGMKGFNEGGFVRAPSREPPLANPLHRGPPQANLVGRMSMSDTTSERSQRSHHSQHPPTPTHSSINRGGGGGTGPGSGWSGGYYESSETFQQQGDTNPSEYNNRMSSEEPYINRHPKGMSTADPCSGAGSDPVDQFVSPSSHNAPSSPVNRSSCRQEDSYERPHPSTGYRPYAHPSSQQHTQQHSSGPPQALPIWGDGGSPYRAASAQRAGYNLPLPGADEPMYYEREQLERHRYDERDRHEALGTRDRGDTGRERGYAPVPDAGYGHPEPTLLRKVTSKGQPSSYKHYASGDVESTRSSFTRTPPPPGYHPYARGGADDHRYAPPMHGHVPPPRAPMYGGGGEYPAQGYERGEATIRDGWQHGDRQSRYLPPPGQQSRSPPDGRSIERAWR